MSPVRNIVVLGGGSAGLLAALTLKRKLPGCDITVVRSLDIGVIGVGEGTTNAVTRHLHEYLNLSYQDFHLRANPTWKLGLRFKWGPRGDFNYSFQSQLTGIIDGFSRNIAYYCESDFTNTGPLSALMTQDKAFPRANNGQLQISFAKVAYHIENERLVSFLETQVQADGVTIVDGTVKQVGLGEEGVSSLELACGRRLTADLFVDASGFGAKLIGQALEEPFESFADTLFCDRAVIGRWDRRPDEIILPYTTVETMDHGWCWRIDHEHHINRGYVYASNFVSDEEAEREFRRKNPEIKATRVVKYRSGVRKRFWVKNVVAIGNAAGFVEPLEASSIGMICMQSRNLASCLIEGAMMPSPSLLSLYNNFIGREWHELRDFLAVHYRFNTMLDTPFWRHCTTHTPLHGAEPLVDFFRENGPSPLAHQTLINGLHQFGLEGYYSMLVGMKVPHEKHYQPPAGEKTRWEAARTEWARQARNGVTVAETLALMRDPTTTWS